MSSYVSGDTYTDALARYQRVGASNADDAALMAAFCAHDIQHLVGAVSPLLVWNGAQASGLRTQQLAHMATDWKAVSDLQWV